MLKPVDINHLIELAGRLRGTKRMTEQQPYDETTNLYNLSFFTLRMIYALERIKQMKLTRFGVMYAQLEGLSDLKEQIEESVFNDFLHEMAEKITSNVRPTDTLAWSPEGYFLTLIDSVPSDEAALILTQRVDQWLRTYLKQIPFGGDLNVKTGVLVCDSEYGDTEEILEDLNYSRTRVAYPENIENRIYFRESLLALRNK